MNIRMPVSLAVTLVLPIGACTQLETAGEQEEVPSTAAASALSVGATANSGAANPVTMPGSNSDGCVCTLRYSDGMELGVSNCEADHCPSITELLACEEEAAPSCRLAASCLCDCTNSFHSAQLVEADDTLLSGVVNLWQFEYGCGSRPPVTSTQSIELNPPNAVGCGPIAAAEIFYWWAQRGYAGLVDGFLGGVGSGPDNQSQDWQGLVQTIYDDYLTTICVPGGQTAVAPPSLTNGLRDFIQDAGYQAAVGHYKVCDDCNVNGQDELTTDAGLALVKSELRAGRPVIMGFNVGRAMEGLVPLLNMDGDAVDWLWTYIGQLSNGTPVLGTISHYGVITGYRRFADQDVITVNLGWGEDPTSSTDVAFLWNPAGKWLHLHTINIQSPPDGNTWCAIDRGLSDTYWDAADLGLSHSTSDIETVLAGDSCGIDRDTKVIEEAGTRDYRTGYYCRQDTTIDFPDRPNDPRITNLNGGSPVIFDPLQPP